MLELLAIRPAELPIGSADPDPDTQMAIDLFPDTALDIVWENPLFLTDRIPAPFSLSFELPATPNNNKIFNYPSRVPIVGVLTSVPALIRQQGVIIAQGELLLMEFDKTIQVQFVGATANLDQKTALNEIEMDGVDFGDTSGIVPFSYLDPKLDKYRNDAATRTNTADPYPYCHAPVRTHRTDWEGNEALRGAMNSLRWYINYWRPVYQDYAFDPETNIHTPVVPFLPVHKILDDAFGDALQNNPFTLGDMRKLVIVSANHPDYNLDSLYFATNLPANIVEFLMPVGYFGINIEWEYKDFMQAYRFNEFFKDLLKIFGMTMFRGLKHVIEYDNDVFDRAVVVNWDEYLDGEPILIREPGKNFIFEYQGENPEFNETTAEFNTWEDLYLEAMEAQWNEEYFYKVVDSPQVLSIKRFLKGITNQHWLESKIVKTPLGSEAPRLKDDTVTIAPALKPLNMNIEQYWAANHNWGTPAGSPGDTINRHHWHVPVMPEKKPDDPPNIMLFAGIKNTFPLRGGTITYEYPLLTNHHTDHFGTKIFDFSLLPEVTDGIVEKFHPRKKAWTEKDKLRLRANFILNAQQIKNLDMRDKFYLRGKTFYIEKIEFSLTHNGISKSDVTLIET